MLQARMQKTFFKWLDKRVQPNISQTLNHRKLFIFLSRQGGFFLVLLLLLLLAAINYQNNLIYALLFLLGSALHSAMFFTFANLSGLRIESLAAKPVFAGDLAVFTLRISQVHKRQRGPIFLHLHPNYRQRVCFTSSQASLEVQLACPTKQRGYLPMPRLLVETYYPLGLLRCWSWLRLPTRCLVYVAPLENSALAQGNTEQGDNLNSQLVAGQDDFSGLREYHQGDNPKHIHWRAFAKGQGLLVREFSGHRSPEVMLDDSLLPNDWPLEKKLAVLCYWALQFHEQGVAFGLKLGATELAISQGDSHLEKVLAAVSLYKVAS